MIAVAKGNGSCGGIQEKVALTPARRIKIRPLGPSVPNPLIRIQGPQFEIGFIHRNLRQLALLIGKSGSGRKQASFHYETANGVRLCRNILRHKKLWVPFGRDEVEGGYLTRSIK